MGVRGDFAGLDELRRRLASLAGAGFRRDMARVLAEEAVKLIDDEFRESRDPYGNPWAPLTSRTGKPLLDTGAHLRNTLTPKATATGFTVSTPFAGAAVHQYGATIKPVRAKALRFGVEGARQVFSYAGGKRLKGYGKASQTNIVYARSVTIPRRQYMPEGDVGPNWRKGLEDAADDYLRSVVGTP